MLFIGGYEVYQSYRYEQWKSAYERMIEQHDTLTIPSPNELLLWEYRPNAEFYDSDLKFHYLSKIHELLEREGIRFQVVLVPVFEESDDDGFRNYPLKDLHQQIANILTEYKTEIVDLIDIFAKQDKGPKFYAYDIWHPNEEGHWFIARQLLRPVLQSYFEAESTADADASYVGKF